MGVSVGRLTEGDNLAYGGREWWRVVVHDLGHGHKEASITRHKTLSELPAWWGQADPEQTQRGAGDRDESIERATRRARTRVRRECKVRGVDALWTLTYRECVTDRSLVLRHWKEFVRRVRQVLPGFAYVATLEQQKRGAWHIHIATQKLPPTLQQRGCVVKSWNLLRAIWRRVTGDLGGNFDESARKRRSRKSAMQLASYISKYVAKSFADGDLNKRRYFCSESVGTGVSRSYLLSVDTPMADVIARVYGEVAAGEVEVRTYLDVGRGLFWISTAAQVGG